MLAQEHCLRMTLVFVLHLKQWPFVIALHQEFLQECAKIYMHYTTACWLFLVLCKKPVNISITPAYKIVWTTGIVICMEGSIPAEELVAPIKVHANSLIILKSRGESRYYLSIDLLNLNFPCRNFQFSTHNKEMHSK